MSEWKDETVVSNDATELTAEQVEEPIRSGKRTKEMIAKVLNVCEIVFSWVIVAVAVCLTVTIAY